MKLRMRTKLTLIFVGISIVSVLAISLLANLLLEREFRNYIIEKNQQRNLEFTHLISQQFDKEEGWNVEMIQQIGVNAIHQGHILTIKDIENNVVWDALEYDVTMCQMMISDMEHNMMSRYPNWKGEYVEESHPIMYNLTRIGTLNIGYYGPFYYNNEDLNFINTLNRAIFWISIILIILAVLLGYIFSERISVPINKVNNMANNISKGDYKVRSNIKSDTLEIQQLSSTMNDLAVILDNQESLRRRLTEDMAHELRTPMATLQSHMEAMIDGIWEPTSDRLKSCHEEIIRINKMIGDLSKLARYQSDSLALNKSSFDIKELIHWILLNFEGESRAKNIGVFLKGDSMIIEADKDKISQVIINLLSNSLKYTHPGGRVEVSIEAQGDKVKIDVADTGQGIDEAHLPYIFERFYRVDKSRNRATGGSGVGLTIAKAIIEAHQGTIAVKSKIDKGSIFTILIPRGSI